MCFFHILSNKCMIIFSFQNKTTTIWKRRRFMIGHYTIFFNFLLFSNASWITNMKPYGCWKIISYILYVHWFYPFFFSNHWIKIWFDLYWILSSIMLSCTLINLFYYCLRLLNNAINIIIYCVIWYLLYITFVGKKWYTHKFNSLKLIDLKNMINHISCH
jgi:hypothetical protein